ncbi:MAG: condensation domain-containing protein, partial [Segetibacter sp.]
MLPIQQWYFDKEPAEVSHYNQSVLLGINKAIDEFVLRAAVEQVTQHHDALRFRYYQQEGKWHQEYGNAKGELIVVDLQSETNASVKTLITEHAEKYQRSLNILKGELIKVVLIKTPASEAYDRLFIVVHHLVIDGVSWRILLDDFERLLSALNSNLEIDLGNKTSSYRQWYETLKQYGESKNVTAQKAYWQQVVSNKIYLPADNEFNGKVKVKDISHYRVLLDAEQTRRLLQEVPKVYHSEINDFLLCALAITICKWSNSEKIIIGLEGHGREGIGEGIDTSRTVGWFTTLYPVLLEIEKGKIEDSWIKSIKEQLRQVPDKGLGYGVLKYINKEEALQNTEPWEIVFNYLGQLDNIVRESKWFAGAGESTGAGMSEELLTEKLSVNSVVRAGQLIVNWSYSKNHYNDETIANLAT